MNTAHTTTLSTYNTHRSTAAVARLLFVHWYVVHCARRVAVFVFCEIDKNTFVLFNLKEVWVHSSLYSISSQSESN